MLFLIIQGVEATDLKLVIGSHPSTRPVLAGLGLENVREGERKEGTTGEGKKEDRGHLSVTYSHHMTCTMLLDTSAALSRASMAQQVPCATCPVPHDYSMISWTDHNHDLRAVGKNVLRGLFIGCQDYQLITF